MKWGILATGTIAKKFASTVEQMGAEGKQLVAVGSRHLESAQAFAQQYGIPCCYDSYEALAADPEVEAIYIATPNTLHYENCKLCLEQGKHVLCEKPFTISPEQAQELYRGLKDRGKATELVFYPREGHGFTEYYHQKDRMQRIYDWVTKYTLSAPGKTIEQ